MEAKRIIVPSAFAGTPLFFVLLHASCYEVVVDYTGFFYKQTFRNRANILTPQGVKSLIVPVIGGRKYGVPLYDIKIDYSENWVHKHLKSLETYYYASPFYEVLIADIKSIYERNFRFLWELNRAFLHYFSDVLSLENHYTENFEHPIACEEDDCIDLRKIYSPKRNYLAKFPDYIPTPYYQLYDPAGKSFYPELSILDMLFNTGPEAGMIIRSMQTTL